MLLCLLGSWKVGVSLGPLGLGPRAPHPPSRHSHCRPSCNQEVFGALSPAAPLQSFLVLLSVSPSVSLASEELLQAWPSTPSSLSSLTATACAPAPHSSTPRLPAFPPGPGLCTPHMFPLPANRPTWPPHYCFWPPPGLWSPEHLAYHALRAQYKVVHNECLCRGRWGEGKEQAALLERREPCPA